jgi:hypothetical protein
VEAWPDAVSIWESFEFDRSRRPYRLGANFLLKNLNPRHPCDDSRGPFIAHPSFRPCYVMSAATLPTVPAAADSLTQARRHPLLFPHGEQHLCQRAPMVFLCLREAKPHHMCRPALIADPARLSPHIFGNPVRQVIVHPHEVYRSGFAAGFRTLELIPRGSGTNLRSITRAGALVWSLRVRDRTHGQLPNLPEACRQHLSWRPRSPLVVRAMRQVHHQRDRRPVARKSTSDAGPWKAKPSCQAAATRYGRLDVHHLI